MLKRLLLVFGAGAALVIPSAYASDIVYPGGGTLAEITDGAGSYTIITLLNLQGTASTYTLSFYDGNGSALTVGTNIGTNSSFSGTLNANGSLIVQTNGTNYAQGDCYTGIPGQVCGYAVLTTSQISYGNAGSSIQPIYVVTSAGNQIAGSAVFSLTLAGQVVQASTPLDTGQNFLFAIPFDYTGDAASSVTGIAITNSNSAVDVANQPLGTGETAYVNVSIIDQNGNAIATPAGQVPTEIINFGAQDTFSLDQVFPQVVGQKGVAIFNSSDSSGYPYDVKILGLRSTSKPSTLTSITPLVPCQLVPIPASQGGYWYCNNSVY